MCAFCTRAARVFALHVCIRSCGAQWSVCLGALVSLLGPLVTGVKPDLTDLENFGYVGPTGKHQNFWTSRGSPYLIVQSLPSANAGVVPDARTLSCDSLVRCCRGAALSLAQLCSPSRVRELPRRCTSLAPLAPSRSRPPARSRQVLRSWACRSCAPRIQHIYTHPSHIYTRISAPLVLSGPLVSSHIMYPRPLAVCTDRGRSTTLLPNNLRSYDLSTRAAREWPVRA